MRNLKTVKLHKYNAPEVLPLAATAWDPSVGKGAIICAFGPTPTQPQIKLQRKACADPEYTTIASWDAPCPLPDLESDEIQLLQYFSDTQTACLVLAGGDIVVVREDPNPGQEKIEIVGSVDVGISAAAWAPDEELLVVVTRSDTLVLMSRDFEPVTETSLSADDLKVSKHVSVGWGKKETQFQGKRAKAMRDPTMPEVVDEGKPSVKEDGQVSISWRGDGAYFAVNSVVEDHRRVVRVFDRQGILDSASEPVDGLESALSWRPYGNLIAGIKRSVDKIEVVFFERNGLRHGEFQLRLALQNMETWASIITLSWNVDSTVLAVCFLDRVQFWTMGNYHHYLKQEILLPQSLPLGKPVAVRWHPEAPLRLSISNYETLMETSFMFAVSRGSATPPNDWGAIAVIDGNTLKLTPLRQAGIPPPMAFCEFQASSNIIDCAISPRGDRIAVLTQTGLDLCYWHRRSDPQKDGAMEKSLAPKSYSTSTHRQSLGLPQNFQYVQVEFRGDSEIFVLGLSLADGLMKLSSYSCLDDFGGQQATNHEVRASVQNIFTDTRCESIWAAGNTTTIMVTDGSDGWPDPLRTMLGQSPADTTLFRTDKDGSEGTNGYHSLDFQKVSLDLKGTLSVNNHILAQDCSSFIVTDAHLIFTTTQHLLKFVHLAEVADMEIPGNTAETDERVRSIERGAKIVTAMPSAYAVVLQMPRGNLETIHPRILVLSGVRRHLKNLEYRMAFRACQKHQVDLNILYNFDPDAFFANVNRFVDQLRKPSRIDEFLSKLKDEDVTHTLYRDTLQRPSTNPAAVIVSPPPTSNKVNRICDAFLAGLASKVSTYLTTVITAHVCKRPPDLTSALTLVSDLHKSSTDQADEAVSHLCFLTDGNKLYNAALALYDLEVTLLIAQHSQRDPREYMPFLQNLNSLPELRRHYAIDNHLKNHSRALESLVALESHDEAEAYTLKHSLYTVALRLYKYNPTYLTKITRLYASYLASNSQNLQAALLYDSLSDHQSAYPLYALAHHWRESLTCAALVPLSASALSSHALSLATTLDSETRDYRSAAHIHEHYLSDPQTAATLLCKGSYFAEALLLISQHFPPDSYRTLTKSLIDPSLLTSFSTILTLLSDLKSQLSSQIPRILELRVKKSQDPLSFYGGEDVDPDNPSSNIPDNISLAPTDTSTLASHTNSLFTRYGNSSQNSRFAGTVMSNMSRKTSKTRRKEERKRARGKKGSVYEEEYLVASVGRLIEKVNAIHDEVRRLAMGLVRRGMREQAERVREGMQEVVKGCEKARGEVWPTQNREWDDGGQGEISGGSGRPKGGEGVLWDAQQEADGMGEGRRDAPEVKGLKADFFPF